ncbi:hypothetical protein FRX31_013586 [Thalictrum thalictroides]|uniref:Uncharacterized protein n=1 Tax=Thalictrum thalictroides TaxID=46969 RepID=A0A7J6WIV0_THATH|nr:hypothetical protein FRX31_013586 [Thalictrum thalictroides]
MARFNLFRCSLACQNREGGRTRIWPDSWIGSHPLCDLFPTIYMISDGKSSTLKEMSDRDGISINWNLD